MCEAQIRRDPGEFLEMAKCQVFLSSTYVDQFREETRKLLICTLTDEALLERKFPKAIPGTLYYLFSTTKNPEEKALVRTQLAERAYREAALGMMDNPIFR